MIVKCAPGIPFPLKLTGKGQCKRQGEGWGGESGRSLRGECRVITYQYDGVIVTQFGGIESSIRSGRKSIAFRQT